MRNFSKRLTAFLVGLSFFSVLQLSALSAPCRDDNEKAPSETIEKDHDSPQVCAEKEVVPVSVGKKKSKLPFILCGIGVATIVAALIIFKSNKKYDIRGKWKLFQYTLFEDVPCSFEGSKKDGVVDLYYGNGSEKEGKYQVNGKVVKISYTNSFDDMFVLEGVFSGENEISGNWYSETGPYSGKWTLFRAE